MFPMIENVCTIAPIDYLEISYCWRLVLCMLTFLVFQIQHVTALPIIVSVVQHDDDSMSKIIQTRIFTKPLPI